MNRLCLGAVCLLAGGMSLAVAAEGQLAPLDKVPAGIPEKIAATLNPAGQQVVIDKTITCNVWLVKELPIKADFKPTLAVKYPLAQGQLVGLLEVVKKSEFTDFRGQEVPAGVYTLRYGQQPVDGNHVGTSALSDFLLAVPVKSDADPATPADPQDLFKRSARTTGSNHPAIYSLLPPKSDEPAPAVVHEKEFWILRLSAAGKSAGAAVKVPLRLVIVGISEG